MDLAGQVTTAKLRAGSRIVVHIGTDGAARRPAWASSPANFAATVERVDRQGRGRLVVTDRGVLPTAPAAPWWVACASCDARALEADDAGAGGRCWDHGGLSHSDRNLPECNRARVANGLEPWPIPAEVARRLAERELAELAPAPVDLAAADQPAPPATCAKRRAAQAAAWRADHAERLAAIELVRACNATKPGHLYPASAGDCPEHPPAAAGGLAPAETPAYRPRPQQLALSVQLAVAVDGSDGELLW